MAIIFNSRKLIVVGLALLCWLIVVSAVYGAVQFYLKHIAPVPFEVSQLNRIERKVDDCRFYLRPMALDGFTKAIVKKKDQPNDKEGG